MPSDATHLSASIAAVVHRHGARALTLQMVADEARMPLSDIEAKLGDADAARLLLHEEAVERWHMILGRSLAQRSGTRRVEERLAAFVIACAQPPRALDLELILDALRHQPDAMRLWDALEERWLEPAPSPQDDAARHARWRIRTAARGLWLREALTAAPLSAERRSQIAHRLAREIDAASTSDAEGR